MKKTNPFWFPLLLLVCFWLVESAEYVFDVSLHQYGLYPRTWSGMKGILFSPFLHGDWNHIINNSLPFLLLGTAIFYFYRPVAYRVFFWSWVLTGIIVWSIARPSFHIGASGLVYSFAAFVFFSGILRSYYRLTAISLLVVFLYGSMIWGVLPIEEGMSWESHLVGAMVGAALAFRFRRYGPQREKYEWMEEEKDEDEPLIETEEGEIPYWQVTESDNAPRYRYHYKSRK